MCILIRAFTFSFVDVFGFEYFLIDPRVVNIVLFVLILHVFIVLLAATDLVCLAVFLQNLGIDFLQNYVLFLKQQVNYI
jgi:hypothetical protein